MVSKFQEWVEKSQKIHTAQHDARVLLASVNQQIVKVRRDQLAGVELEIRHHRCEAEDLKTALEQGESEREKIDQLIQEQHKKVSDNMLQLKQITRANAKLNSLLQAMRAEKATVHTRLAHFRREQEVDEALLIALKAETVANSSTLVEKQELLEGVKEAIKALQGAHTQTMSRGQDIQEVIREIELLETEEREATLKQAQYARERRETQRISTTIEKDIEACLRTKVELETTISTLEKTLHNELQAFAKRGEEVEELRRQMDTLERDLGLQMRRRSKIVSTSRGDRTIHQLQESLGRDAVLGRLWELASTESTYAIAVNSAMRAQLSFVVVRDRRTAVRIARVFTDEAIGRISCCVLEDLDEQLECSNATCGTSVGDKANTNFPIPLCQVLRCTSTITRRIFHKFGCNWMICQDTDQATQLSSRGTKHFVTLGGDQFLSDGSIRACRSEAASAMSSGPKIQRCDIRNKTSSGKATDNYDTLIANLSAQLSDCQIHHTESQRIVKKLEENIQALRLKISVTREQLKEICNHVETSKVKLVQVKQKLEHFGSLSVDPHLKASNDLKSKIAELKKRKARLTKKGEDKTRAKLLTKQAQITKDIALVKEREVLNKTSISKLNGKQQAIAQQLSTLQMKSEGMSEEEGSLNDQLKAVQAKIDARKMNMDTANASVGIAKSKLEACEAVIRSLTAKQRDVQHTINRLWKTKDSITHQITAVERENADVGIIPTEQGHVMDVNSPDQLDVIRSKVREDLDKLDDEQRVLELMKSTISVDTVERAIACEQELVALQAELDSALADMSTLSSQQHEIATTRHEQLVGSLRVVNENLSRVYRVMNEDGDCYLGYSLERTTLFTEGITLNCKPDESHWQSFVGLSGGQQVVCAVSLMLALQASFPSPFYVCDEIDAALDTVNVRKLAELLRDQSRQSSTQFLVVSHRPQMWEVAKYLIGVYEREKSAQIVSCRFE